MNRYYYKPKIERYEKARPEYVGIKIIGCDIFSDITGEWKQIFRNG